MSKLDLSYVYMRLWVWVYGTPYISFFIPKKNLIDEQLVGFHLSLLMGFVDNVR